MSLLDALRARGVPVDAHPGWEDATNRGRDRAETVGIVNHWDAISSWPGDALYTHANRFNGLLYHIVVDQTGVAHLYSQRYVYHAGGGDSAVLDALRRGATPPEPTIPKDTNGNPHTVGVCVNYYPTGWPDAPYPALPDAQYDTLVKVNAALCDHYGLTPAQIIDHAGWTTRKHDIRGVVGFNLPILRRDVTAMRNGGAVTPTPSDFTTYPGTVHQDGGALVFRSGDPYGRFVTRTHYDPPVTVAGTMTPTHIGSGLRTYDGLHVHVAHQSNSRNYVVSLVRHDRSQAIKSETADGYDTLAGRWGTGPKLEQGQSYPFQVRWTADSIEAWVEWRGDRYDLTAAIDPGLIPDGQVGFRFDRLNVRIDDLTITTPTSEEQEGHMFVAKGAAGSVVEYWQQIMQAIDPNALPRFGADGDYGDETADWVARLTDGDGSRIGPQEAAQLHSQLGAGGPHTHKATVSLT